MAKVKMETAETEDSTTMREKLPDAPRSKPGKDGEYANSGVVSENTREEKNYRKGQSRAMEDSKKGDLDERLKAVREGHDMMNSARDRYEGRFEDNKGLDGMKDMIQKRERDRAENRRIGGYSRGGKVSTGSKREYPKGKC